MPGRVRATIDATVVRDPTVIARAGRNSDTRQRLQVWYHVAVVFSTGKVVIHHEIRTHFLRPPMNLMPDGTTPDKRI